MTDTSSRLAHLIEVEQVNSGPNRGFRFRIDGQDFPWFISEDGIRTGTTINEIPYVDIRILAEQVTFNNDWTRSTE